MGIPGLLVALKSVTYPVHISEYRGLTVGVDAYGWLHRGTFSCSTALCTNADTDKYVTFCMRRVRLLKEHGAEPLLVFDGASLPLKGNKHLERRRQRERNMAKGQEALALGEAGAAAHHFSKAAAVTHQMAYELIKALRRAGVKFMVAPYEADAQLAHLSRTGAVDAVITEDSDCLPYGCKKILFKMDNEGNGQEIQLRNLAANKPLSLCNWTNSMFLDLCLLVGCDYITASVKGLGITTAHKLVDQHRKLDRIIHALENTKLVVPEGYWEQYRRARLTFRHHIVYDPQTESTIHLMPLGDSAREVQDLDFLGMHLPPTIAQGVGSGCLHPKSHEPCESNAAEEPCASGPPAPAKLARNPEGLRPLLRMSCAVEANGGAPLKEAIAATERTLSGHNAESNGEYTQAKHQFDNIESVKGRLPPSEPYQPLALIERPFSARRHDVAALLSPANETANHVAIPSSVPSVGSTLGNWWGQQDCPGRQSLDCEPNHGLARTCVTTRHIGGKYGHLERYSTSRYRSLPGGKPLESVGTSNRLNVGLDLAHVREALSPPRTSSSLSSPVRQGPLRREGVGPSPNGPSAASGLPPSASPVERRTRPVKHGLSDDLRPRRWQDEATSCRNLSEGYGLATASCPFRDDAREKTSTSSRQTLRGEEYGPVDTLREAVGRQESAPSQMPLLYNDGMGSGRFGGVDGSAGPDEDGGDAADLFGWTCYSARAFTSGGNRPGWQEAGPKELVPKRAELRDPLRPSRHPSDIGEGEASHDVGPCSLEHSFSNDRSKYVPASARHFRSIQVSQGLETLQRRKRRLCLAGESAPDALSAPDWLRPPDFIRQNIEAENDQEAEKETFQRVSCDRPSQGPWMRQSYPRTDSVLIDGVGHFQGCDGIEESAAACSLSFGSNPAFEKERPRPAIHRDAGAPVRNEEKSMASGSRDGQAKPLQPLAESSRRWTVPMSILRSRGPSGLPLLRLMGGNSDDSFHGRVRNEGSSYPLTKRSRCVQYWDARLMR